MSGILDKLNEGIDDTPIYKEEAPVSDLLSTMNEGVDGGPVFKGVEEYGAEVPGLVESALGALESYGASPMRAGIGALQTGGGFSEAYEAAKSQFGEPVQPSTPSWGDIATHSMVQSGVPYPYAEKMAPAAQIAGEAIVDPLQLIPSKAVIAPLKAVTKIPQAAMKPTFKLGEMMTGGGLDARRALDAVENLGPLELILPGGKSWGPLAKAGEELAEVKKSVDNVVVPVNVPDLIKMRERMARINARPEFNSPGADRLIQSIDRLINRPISFDPVHGSKASPITIDDMDAAITAFQQVTFTTKGNETVASLSKLWGPTIRNIGFQLNSMLDAIPEGQLFREAKTRYSDLKTAQKGKSSQLREIGAVLGGAGSTGLFLLNDDPQTAWASGMAAILSLSISPTAYMKLAGAAKIPEAMGSAPAKMLDWVWERGSLKDKYAAIRWASTKSPEAIERFVRGMALVAGKPEQEQLKIIEAIKKKDSATIKLVTDPMLVDARINEIKENSKLSNIEKSKKINEIVRMKGYIEDTSSIIEPTKKDAPKAQPESSLDQMIESLNMGFQ